MFDVFVPRVGTYPQKSIAAGSALVSAADGESFEGRRACYYEGNVYGCDYFSHYSVRLLHAAGRAKERYPTVARGWFDEGDLVRVGSYDLALRRLEISDRDALEAWLGCSLEEASESDHECVWAMPARV